MHHSRLYAVMTLALSAALLVACGQKPEPLTVRVDSPEVVRARADDQKAMLTVVERAAKPLKAKRPLAVRQDVQCHPGQNNVEVHDGYRAICVMNLSTAFAISRPTLHDLLQIQKSLDASGWSYGAYSSTVWSLTGGRGYADLTNPRSNRFQLEDIEGAAFTHDTNTIRLSFLAPEDSTPTPEPVPHLGLGSDSYDASSSGSDWQSALSKDPGRPYLLVVSENAIVGRQDL